MVSRKKKRQRPKSLKDDQDNDNTDDELQKHGFLDMNEIDINELLMNQFMPNEDKKQVKEEEIDMLPFIAKQHILQNPNEHKKEERNENNIDLINESLEDLKRRGQDLKKWYNLKGSLNVPEVIMRSLSDSKFLNPTSVQDEVIETFYKNERNDIVVASETGSGKTLAFLIPAVSEIINNKQDVETTSLKGIIVAPSREIASQISDVLTNLVKYATNLKFVLCIGGISHDRQSRIINKRKPSLIIGTPGRIWALMNGTEDKYEPCLYLQILHQLNILILDEADQMTSSNDNDFKGLLNLLTKINKINQNNIKFRKLLFSATMSLPHHLKKQNPRKRRKKMEQNKEKKEQTLIEQLVLAVGINTNRLDIIDLTATAVPNSKREAEKKIRKDKRKNELETNNDQLANNKLSAMEESGLTKVILKLPSGLRIVHEKVEDDKRDRSLYLQLAYNLKRGEKAIVFVNAISSVHRICSLLSYLFGSKGEDIDDRLLKDHVQNIAQKISVIGVQSDLKQGERLKRLSKFKNAETGILVCTDGWARGLDIDDVKYVIHYHCPRNAAIFVHRSGRTARGINGTGTAICLESPSDFRLYRAIFKSVGVHEPEELEWIKILNKKQFQIANLRVQASVEITKEANELTSQQKKKGSLKAMADALDVDVPDDDSEDDSEDENTNKIRKQKLKMYKIQLYSSLGEDIFAQENLFATAKSLTIR